MKYKPEQKIAQILLNAPMLNKLWSKLSNLSKINEAVATFLDPELAKNCQVANLRNGTLILTTTSPAWNHQMRFLKIDLLNKLRKVPEWRGLKAIEIKVQYLPDDKAYQQPKVKHKPRLISYENAALLEQTAANIKYPELANRLKQLAKYTTKKKS